MAARKGVKLRPTVERETLYRRVLELKKEGRSYNQIIRKVKEERGVTLNKSHISDWITSKHKPFGSVREPDLSPTPELAYLIGVKMGDASTSVSNYSYMIKLRVKDREFAEEFSRCLSVVLHRSPPRVRWDVKTSLWHTQASSLLLQGFLKRPLGRLKHSIEHCDDCASAFLRGFFDSEGWVYRLQLGVSNTNKPVLKFASYLLEKRFRIRTHGPRLKSRGGRIVMIKGRLWRANKDCYDVLVARNSMPQYLAKVGFTIHRKKGRLSSAVGQISMY